MLLSLDGRYFVIAFGREAPTLVDAGLMTAGERTRPALV